MGNIEFKFDEEKAIESVQYLLKKGKNQKEEYIRIIKLLYLADREALDGWGWSISTDKYYSMTHGMVLSNILDFIHYPNKSEKWNNYIGIADDMESGIEIKKEIGNVKLTIAEQEVLDEIFEKYKEMPTWGEHGLIELVIHNLSEWDKRAKEDNTSIYLPLNKLLKNHLNKSNAVLEDIEYFSKSK